MKNLFDLILARLAFKDRTGKRLFCALAVLGGAALLLLLVLFGASALERHATMRATPATPRPVDVTETPTALPTLVATSEPVQPTGCPTNPDDWFLADVFISQNYKLIQPACVYDGLAHSVAWALAVRQGYSRAEATALLDFAEMPMRQIKTPGNKGEPQDTPLSFIPPPPDFTEWRVNAGGEPAVAYALRGCFSTSNVAGNKVEIWGGAYPIICVVVEDAENTHVVYALDGHTFTVPASPTRSFLLFGYAGDGLWVWLNARENPKTPIDDPARFANDRLTIATLYDSQPWNAQWLQERFSLTMRPLPEHWQDFKDDAEMQVILDTLNQFLGGQ